MQASQAKSGPKVFFAQTGMYRHLFDCLTVGELFGLAALNREALKTVNSLAKKRLLQEGVELPGDCSDFLRLYRDVHLRSVIILPLNSLNTKEKVDIFTASKISKKTLFIDRIISDFSFGIKFVGYYFPNRELILLTKSSFLTLPKQQLVKETNQRSLKGVTKFGLEARHATVLDSDSQLKALLYMKNQSIEEMREIFLEKDVVDFALNYTYLAFQVRSGDFFVISKFSDINLGLAVKYKISMPKDTYELFLSGLNFYVRDSAGSLFFTPLKDIDPIAVDGNNSVKCLTMSEYSFLDKPIQHIFTGLRNEILMIRNDYKTSASWSNEEVRGWFRSIGVGGIDGILKYEKFTGEQLQSIDKKMLIERFGIKNTDVHNKIHSEISLEMQKTTTDAELYGLGFNLDGQLCINDSHKHVSMFTKMKLPELSSCDAIQQIQFGWTNTLIITKEGRIFISYKKPKKKPTEEEDRLEEDLQRSLRPKAVRKVSGLPPRKESAPEPDSPADLPLGKKRKSSKRYEQECSAESSESEENRDANVPAKQRKKKKPQEPKGVRGHKKERRKTSFAPAEGKRDEDEGFARWVEITNLFVVNRYPRLT